MFFCLSCRPVSATALKDDSVKCFFYGFSETFADNFSKNVLPNINCTAFGLGNVLQIIQNFSSLILLDKHLSYIFQGIFQQKHLLLGAVLNEYS